MNRLICAVVATITAVAALAETEQLTPEQIAKREASRMRTGGLILDTRAQRGKVVVYNAQKLVEAATIRTETEKIATETMLRFEVAEASPVAFADAKSLRDSNGGEVAVILSDTPAQPALAVLPDDALAYIGVEALKGGDVTKRVATQLRRAVAYACGCGSSAGLMARVAKPADLERAGEAQLPYTTIQSMTDFLKELGVVPGHMVLYSKACREGWAPKPSNKYQKSAWKRVHEMPYSPLKIKFDPATQKGKVTK